MNTTEKDDIFAQKAKAAFDASLAGLDQEILARLRAARARAVDAVGQPAPWFQGWRLPAGAAALLTVGVLGGLLWLGLGGSNAPATPFSNANTDAPLMMANDSIDLYADMDFYQWMAAQDQPAQKPQEPADEDQEDDDDSGVGG
ncbi:MAG: DUF3619 family protein [Bacillota bacterium]